MLKAPQLLLIGGNARDVGKTTVACGIISSFSSSAQIAAFKITSIYENDTKQHGKHELITGNGYSITKEMLSSSPKDPAKMLKAGATFSYYIQAMDHAVEKAWMEFIEIIPSHYLLVCESRTLRRFVEPDIFIYLKSSKVKNEKPYSQWLEKLADILLVDPNHVEISGLLRRITIAENRWIIF